MDPNIFYAAFFFPAAAAVLVFFMKYVSAILQARVRMAQDEAYREIAAKAAAAQGRRGPRHYPPSARPSQTSTHSSPASPEF